MKIDYDSSGIETNYFLIRARIELIKTDYILIGFNQPFSAGQSRGVRNSRMEKERKR